MEGGNSSGPPHGMVSAPPHIPPALDKAREEVNLDVLDMGRVLVQAISDLKQIRDDLGLRDPRELAHLLATTEEGLRKKAEAVLSVSADGGRFTSQLSAVPATSLVHRGVQEEQQQPRGRSVGKGRAGKTQRRRQQQRDRPRAGEDMRGRIRQNFMATPTSDAARAYLQERYGIEPTVLHGANMRSTGGARTGMLYPHKTSVPNRVLAKEVRENPLAAAPPEIIDAELHKGLHHLLIKGIIPTNQDLSDALVGQHAPVQMLPAPVRRFEDKFARAPITTALEDHATGMQNLYRLDMMAPPNALPTWEESEREVEASLKPKEVDPEGDPEEQARAYAELMDQYSLHEFLIRRGSTVDSTPEFLSFHRTYSEKWGPIAELVLQLEGICTQYAVPLAIINGKQLAELSEESMARGGDVVPMEDLLGCIKNIQQVAAVLQQPGRRYKGPTGPSEAATRIQSVFRGARARHAIRRVKQEAAAAISIQHAWASHRERQKTLGRIMEARLEREQQFQALQKWLADYWEAIEGSQHVVVHVPSMSVSAEQKMDLDRFQARQNAQMSRMCDVADPLVDVLYVAPFQLGDDVDGYWNKLLEVGGVSNPAGRCRIVYPENYERLPLNMSLSAQLLSSPRALKRIRAHVKGRPAYIVPGHVGDDEKDLAVALGLPLLAPHPSIVLALSRKSAARSIFMEAKMNVPPGRNIPAMLTQESEVAKLQRNKLHADSSTPEDVVQRSFDAAAIVAWTNKGGARTPQERMMTEFVGLLAELIVTHPTVVRWIIKIDDASGGRGHAYLDIIGLKVIEQALDRLVNVSTARTGNSAAFDVLDDESRALALQQTKDILLRVLPGRVVLGCRETFPTWDRYLLAFCDRGGVIEACPRMVTGSPSANIFIDPAGECSVLSTQEQIFCPAYRYVGASFPQSSVPHSALCDAALAIGYACFRAGIIGHIGVDFVAHREEGLLRLWAVDLNIACTSTLSNFQLFDFLAAGEIDLRQGSYYVPDDEMSEDHRDVAGGEPFQKRFFTTVDFLTHRGLSSMQYASFFNKCRLNGLAFDMQDRLGTVFNVIDSFASGVLGIVSVGRTPYESFAELAEVLEFMGTELGTRGLEAETDAQGFKNVYSTFKYLADRLRPGLAQ